MSLVNRDSVSFQALPVQWTFSKMETQCCEISAIGKQFSVSFYREQREHCDRSIYEAFTQLNWYYDEKHVINEYKKAFHLTDVRPTDFSAKLARLFFICTGNDFRNRLQLVSNSKEQETNLTTDAAFIQSFILSHQKEWSSMKAKDRRYYNLGDEGLPRSLDAFLEGKQLHIMILPRKKAQGESSEGGGSKNIHFCIDWLTGKKYVQGLSLPTAAARGEVTKEYTFYKTYQGKVRGIPGPMIGVANLVTTEQNHMIYYQEQYDGNLRQLLVRIRRSPDLKLNAIQQLLATFWDLFNLGIGHFDPKLENVLYMGKNNIQFLTCDFGSYTSLKESWVASVPKGTKEFKESLKDLLIDGTPGYISPECWIARYFLRSVTQEGKKIKNFQKKCSLIDEIAPREKRDVFGLGVLFLQFYDEEKVPLVGSNSRMDEILCLREIGDLESFDNLSLLPLYAKIQNKLNSLFKKMWTSLNSRGQLKGKHPTVLALIWWMMQADPKKRIQFSKNLEKLEIEEQLYSTFIAVVEEGTKSDFVIKTGSRARAMSFNHPSKPRDRFLSVSPNGGIGTKTFQDRLKRFSQNGND